MASKQCPTSEKKAEMQVSEEVSRTDQTKNEATNIPVLTTDGQPAKKLSYKTLSKEMKFSLWTDLSGEQSEF